MDFIRKRTLYDWILEVLSLLILIYSLISLFFFRKIPEDALIPIHFNALGQPDRWGDRYYILIYPLLALIFYILLSILERNYKVLNFPIKITNNNCNAVYRLGVGIVRHLKLFIPFIFGYLGNSSLALVMNNGKGADQIVLIVWVGGLFITLIYFTIRIFKYR